MIYNIKITIRFNYMSSTSFEKKYIFVVLDTKPGLLGLPKNQYSRV